jgi:hypothetical protein
MMVSARTAITMRELFACELLFAILLQLGFNLMRQLQTDTLYPRDFLRFGGHDGFDGAKAQNEFLAAGRPQAGYCVQAGHQPDFTTSIPMRCNREAVRFVADALNEIQPLGALFQPD